MPALRTPEVKDTHSYFCRRTLRQTVFTLQRSAAGRVQAWIACCTIAAALAACADTARRRRRRSGSVADGTCFAELERASASCLRDALRARGAHATRPVQRAQRIYFLVKRAIDERNFMISYPELPVTGGGAPAQHTLH